MTTVNEKQIERMLDVSMICQVNLDEMEIVEVDGIEYIQFDIRNSDLEFAFDEFDIIQDETYNVRIELNV